MIVDAHCHIWERWPYEDAVPDPEARARPEMLLYEMDRNGVDQAVVICAGLGGNVRNTDFAFEAAARNPGRFTVFPDLECRWSDTYRTPGAARRLEEALARWDFAGFTHYPEVDDDCAWFASEEGRAFFGLAAERGLIASLSVLPNQMRAAAKLAEALPTLPILCHHAAHLGPRFDGIPGGLEAVLDAASYSNVYIKLSGAYHASAPGDDYPFDRSRWVAEVLMRRYGPDRIVWGSDYPVLRTHMTYEQSLRLPTDHYHIEEPNHSALLGGTMLRILDGRR